MYPSCAVSPTGPGAGFGDTGRGEVVPQKDELISSTLLDVSEDEKIKLDRERRVEWIINRLMEDSGEFTPLPPCVAASLGDVDSMKQSITRGVDINEYNRGGWTPLMYAAYIGHNSAVKLLMDSGGKSELHDRHNRTALMLAASCGNDKVVSTLLEYQANLNAQDKKGWNALFYAACLNHTNTVRVLLKRGADPNQVEKTQGMTPFHLACGNGHELMVQIFLEFGIDLTIKAKSGDTARSLAVLNHRVKIVDLIDRHRQGTGGKKKEETCTIDLPDLSAFGGLYECEKKKGGTLKTGRVQPQLSVVEEKPIAAVSAVAAGVAMSPRIFNGSAKSEQARRISVSEVVKMRPKSLADLLHELQLSKYLPLFEEEAVDLASFLQLTDKDLKDVGIKLLGPRKKMTNAIARWHSEGPVVSENFHEAVYANYQREKADSAGQKLQEVTREVEKIQERYDVQNEEFQNCQKQLEGCKKALDAAKELMQANKNLAKYCLGQIEKHQHCQHETLDKALRKILNNSDEGLIKILGTTV